MKIELNLKKKFRIRETLGLSTNAESSAHTKTDGIFYMYIFFGGGVKLIFLVREWEGVD